MQANIQTSVMYACELLNLSTFDFRCSFDSGSHLSALPCSSYHKWNLFGLCVAVEY